MITTSASSWQPSNDDRDACLDDAGFLAGNGRQGVTQQRLVIEVDGRDRSDDWRDDIGGVQPSTESDLENSDAHVFPAEQLERDRGCALEERGREGRMHLLDPLDGHSDRA